MQQQPSILIGRPVGVSRKRRQLLV